MIFSWREENQRGQQERLDFVVPGNRKKQKLELKIGSWHKFQKGINSECTLEWKLWSAMEFTEPLLDFFPPAVILFLSRFFLTYLSQPDKNLTTSQITNETFPTRTSSAWSFCFLVLYLLIMSITEQIWSYRVFHDHLTTVTTWSRSQGHAGFRALLKAGHHI